MTLDRIAIVGAGGWGTALAALWARNSKEIILWGHNAKRIEQMKQTRENRAYLPGIQLPGSVHLTSQLEDISTADLVVMVTPSVTVRALSATLRNIMSSSATVFLSCTKGIEHGSGMRMSEIIESLFPTNVVAVLSGPNLAIEVSRGFPQRRSSVAANKASPRFCSVSSEVRAFEFTRLTR